MIRETELTEEKTPFGVEDVMTEFDNASSIWRKNKRRIGNSFYYVCTYVRSNGRMCKKLIDPPTYSNTLNPEMQKIKINRSNVFCYRHQRRYQDPDTQWWLLE